MLCWHNNKNNFSFSFILASCRGQQKFPDFIVVLLGHTTIRQQRINQWNFGKFQKDQTHLKLYLLCWLYTQQYKATNSFTCFGKSQKQQTYLNFICCVDCIHNNKTTPDFLSSVWQFKTTNNLICLASEKNFLLCGLQTQ